MKRICLSLCFLISFTTLSFSEIKWFPMAKVEVLGGQLFFDGKNTSFSGNGNWTFTSALKVNEKISIVPLLTGKYRRMREVQELIGGGFLTRETLDNTVSVSGIYKINSQWRAKAKTNFRNQLLVESVSEKLGNGLFDSNKYGFGLEIERKELSFFKSVSLAFNPYLQRYIRYKSLFSETKFGSEVKGGVDTLDFNAYDTVLSGDVVLPRNLRLSAMTLLSYRVYTDQFTVTSSGKYTDKLRKDIFSMTTLEASHPLPPLAYKRFRAKSVASLELGYSIQNSNQHNHDAARNKFNENYYDYKEYSITPKISARIMDKLDTIISYQYSRRNYSDRVTQMLSGNYKSDLLHQDDHAFSYSFQYPILYGLSALAQGVYRRTTSNMDYEATYKYTYSSQHYYLGISWVY